MADKSPEILVAEDSPTQAEQLRHVLAQNGFRVVVTGNGKEALSAIRARKPTLVITDISMPEMDGYELCSRIRSEPQLLDLPVILLTALSDPDDVFRGLQCGADNFISKPYDWDYLISRIRHLLENAHLRIHHETGTGMQVTFAGETHVIHSDRAQILNMLLSVYEAAVQRNRELEQARGELRSLNDQLETKVQERTASLEAEVAERQRAEQAVKELNATLEIRVTARTAELAAANKELESFSYSVSHDLRAPLRAISGYSRILLNRWAGQLPEEGQELLASTIASASRMSQLIDDLLRFSRLSRQPLLKRTVNVASLVGEVLGELQRAAGDRAIEVRVGDLPPCQGDPSFLRQVFDNLLSNAFKFTRGKVPAIVEVGCDASGRDERPAATAGKEPALVEAGCNPPPDGTVYFVRDNGAGFEMQYSEKLFGVFQRLHTSEQFEGTGIGLSIVQRIIQRHGGRIWAEAEVDKGATFYFTLPEG